eukprot:4647877-Pyramimonas_sp.AAC.1
MSVASNFVYLQRHQQLHEVRVLCRLLPGLGLPPVGPCSDVDAIEGEAGHRAGLNHTVGLVLSVRHLRGVGRIKGAIRAGEWRYPPIGDMRTDWGLL